MFTSWTPSNSINLETGQCSFKVMVRVIRNTEQIPCEYSLHLFILEKARLREVTKEVYTILTSTQAEVTSYFE